MVLAAFGVSLTFAQKSSITSLHQLEYEAHIDCPVSPDLVGDNTRQIIPLRLPSRSEELCATVFGYLPYWESSANIHWDLLTHVAAFGVSVNADGTLGNDHGWPWTSMVNTAHANGVKVVLTATLFSPSNALTLVTTPEYKAAFFENIKNKMLEGTADGINIDFEGSGTYLAYINEFMADLTEYMHTEVPGSEVTFAGPAVNWGSWDLPGLAASCDGIFIMGYAFAGSWNSYTSANAPLIGGSINITDTVLDEYYPLAQVDPRKLILGLPYYGGHWTTNSSEGRTEVVDWIGSSRFATDQPNAEYYGRQWDTFSQTPWYRWYDGSYWHQVWYDDAESLGLKYQLAIDNNLQGVGMWALNYDGSREELWNLLREKFVDDCCTRENPGDAEIVLYEDDFDDGNSAAAWNVYASSADYTVDFAFDYSSRGIPPAPNSDGGSTIGLHFTVNNNDGSGDEEAVSAYPMNLVFAGDYALRFDMWLNYNGGSGGGTGSTEFMTAGINHAGDRVNWYDNSASDGYYFAVDGEGGAGRDYRGFDGADEYTDTTVYKAGSQDSAESFYQYLFSQFETPGSPGKQWVEVDLRQVEGMIEWRLDGVLIAVIDDARVHEGNIMLGYMDPYASIANPAQDNFVIYDNLRVTRLPLADCNQNGFLDSCESGLRGDYDGDGAVNLADYYGLAECLNGPGLYPDPAVDGCQSWCLTVFDYDADGDVDLADAAAFAADF